MAELGSIQMQILEYFSRTFKVNFGCRMVLMVERSFIGYNSGSSSNWTEKPNKNCSKFCFSFQNGFKAVKLLKRFVGPLKTTQVPPTVAYVEDSTRVRHKPTQTLTAQLNAFLTFSCEIKIKKNRQK